MKNMVAVAVLTGIVVTAGAVFTASKSDDEILQRAKDREAIEQLMWRYARALDGADAETYASLYTADGQFSAGANPTKGREALKKMITPPPAGRPPMYHMTANHQLTFVDKDHVRIDAYYITMVAAAGRETPSRVAGVGRSIDELERVNGQWLIKSRNVAPMN